MKKLIIAVLAVVLVLGSVFAFTSCKKDEGIVVYTNAFFAPFEYYDADNNIVGVDVEIMNKVGEKMGKKVTIKSVEFSTIIDAVSEGKLCDCGAAGITITDARKEKVDFSIPYYTSVQYAIFKNGLIETKQATDETECIFWEDLAGKKIGVQLDTTGNIYVDLEINGDHGDDVAEEEKYYGVLEGKGATCKPFEEGQLAYENLKSNQIDVLVIDKLPAKYLTKNDNEYTCVALYYDADTATEEEYAIAVNKGQTELLKAINEVLDEMLKDVDAKGNSAIMRLVAKHFGIEE